MSCSFTVRKRPLSMKQVIACVVFAVCSQIGYAEEAKTVKQLSDQERVILFVIQQESTANALETRRDVCVGFGSGLSLNEKAILSALPSRGLKFHSEAWCNRGPKGVSIAIKAPVKQTSPGVYELMVEFGDIDPIRLYGEHFATVLRRGTYVVKCATCSEPALESYRETCYTSRPIVQSVRPN